MHVRSHTRIALATLAGLGLSFSLIACGGSESPDSADQSVSESSDSGQSDQDESASSSGGELPGDLPDFPLPDEYTVQMAQGRDGAWTVILTDVPGGWEESRSFYETELADAGWEVLGDRPFAAKEGTELDATKDDLEATVGLTYIDETTNVTINLVQG